MKNYMQFLNEDLNPYVGFYKVPSIKKIMENLKGKVEYEYDKDNNVVIIEYEQPTAYKIVIESGGNLDFEWAKTMDFPKDGVVIRSKPFKVPDGFVL